MCWRGPYNNILILIGHFKKGNWTVLRTGRTSCLNNFNKSTACLMSYSNIYSCLILFLSKIIYFPDVQLQILITTNNSECSKAAGQFWDWIRLSKLSMSAYTVRTVLWCCALQHHDSQHIYYWNIHSFLIHSYLFLVNFAVGSTKNNLYLGWNYLVYIPSFMYRNSGQDEKTCFWGLPYLKYLLCCKLSPAFNATNQLSIFKSDSDSCLYQRG